MNAHILAISAQANVNIANVKVRSTGRSQNRQLMRGQQV
jgi:hypothetical protein